MHDRFERNSGPFKQLPYHFLAANISRLKYVSPEFYNLQAFLGIHRKGNEHGPNSFQSRNTTTKDREHPPFFLVSSQCHMSAFLPATYAIQPIRIHIADPHGIQ